MTNKMTYAVALNTVLTTADMTDEVRETLTKLLDSIDAVQQLGQGLANLVSHVSGGQDSVQGDSVSHLVSHGIILLLCF